MKRERERVRGEEKRSIYTPARSRRGKHPYPRGLARSRFDDFSFSSFSLFFFVVCVQFPLAILRGDEMKSIMPANRSFYFSQEVGVYFGARRRGWGFSIHQYFDVKMIFHSL